MGLYTPRFPSVTRGGDAPTLRSASLERRAPLRAPRARASAAPALHATMVPMVQQSERRDNQRSAQMRKSLVDWAGWLAVLWFQWLLAG